ncbi:hypothetical protein FPCIR_7967 [Fusarium pseudocircinatum]|uniref:Uncharacterized protein n=1 Tax=Fusarium pseudocircinatum TaxID=56676 RepID=A0A8H5P1E8_9HYPO|nr:hypothetical protein FPCIR_7967 [Fusarium pseudocircinatum]
MAASSSKDGSQKPPIGKTLMRLTDTLCTISEQRPYDKDAQRRALAGMDLCRRRLTFSRPWKTFLQEPAIKCRAADSPTASQTDMESRLPTEIYIIIIEHLVNDRYGKSPEQMEVRAQTLQSLASTCRMFQVLCEKYLYTHPRSQRLSKDLVSKWLFLFSLTVEPRRAHQVRSLRYKPQPHCTYPTGWLNTLELCTNLTHLELVWGHHIPECVRHHMYMYMGPIFAACPKVTEFKYKVSCYLPDDEPHDMTPEQIAKFSQQYSKFAKQLCHMEVLGAFDYIKDILHYDYPNLKSLVLDMGDYEENGRFFKVLSCHTPALEKLVLDWVQSATLVDLWLGFKAWGKTLRSLYINRPLLEDHHGGILRHLLPHLTRLEDLGLGETPTFLLSDLQALAQPNAPRLKTFRWVADDGIFTRDPLANPENVSKAITDILVAHSETLSTFTIEESFSLWNFGTDIFEHLHKARNLENLRVQLHDIPTKEDIQGLLTACPKLGKSKTGLMVVREFFTECTLTTMKYKEDNFEALESSWGSIYRPAGAIVRS